jgi:hypothetical protein
MPSLRAYWTVWRKRSFAIQRHTRRACRISPASGGTLTYVSSKTARLHRRQAANRRKYARLRKVGRVLRHTKAERKLAAAEREHQREADQYRQWWKRQVTLPVATTVAAAAASVVFGAGHAKIGIADLYRPLSAVTQFNPWVHSSESDYPDPPHVPEQDVTNSPVFFAAGTARADRASGPVPAGAWFPWEWTGSPNVFGD